MARHLRSVMAGLLHDWLRGTRFGARVSGVRSLVPWHFTYASSQLVAELGTGAPAKLAGHMQIEAHRLRDVLFSDMRSMQLIHLCAIGLRSYVWPALDRRDTMATKRVGIVGGVAFAAREGPRRISH